MSWQGKYIFPWCSYNRWKELLEIQGGYLKNQRGIKFVLTYVLRFSVQVLLGIIVPQMSFQRFYVVAFRNLVGLCVQCHLTTVRYSPKLEFIDKFQQNTPISNVVNISCFQVVVGGLPDMALPECLFQQHFVTNVQAVSLKETLCRQSSPWILLPFNIRMAFISTSGLYS